jgi:peptidoglycan/LPS O-acetylase OafA/YrhL
VGIIRVLLALSVLISHSGPILGFKGVGGLVAVESFYIISGFYMSMVLAQKYRRQYRLFITNRMLRLFPIYWAVVALTLFYRHSFISFFALWDHFDGFANFFMKFTNIFLFGQDWVMFIGVNPNSGHLFFTPDFALTTPKLYTFLLIPQAWTLGVELTFYLFAPFLVRMRLRWVFVVMALSVAIRAWLYSHGFKHDPWNDRFFPTELFYFLAGRVSYEIYIYLRRVTIPRSVLTSALFALLLVIGILPAIPFDAKKYLLYAAVVVCMPFCFLRFKSSKVDTWIGELSYPIYICHALVIEMAGEQMAKNGIQLALGTIVASIALNVVIAKPIDRWRESRIKAVPQQKTSEVAA